MLDYLNADELKPIATIAKHVTGKRPSRPTIWRWLRRGVAGGVTLEAVYVYGTWHTTEAAFRDFLTRRSAAMLAPRDPVCITNDDDLRAAGLL